MTAPGGSDAAANDPLSSGVQARLRQALRAFARERLPEAMVPARFVLLDRLPTLPNGKVDRARLPELDVREPAGGSYVPPATPEQAAVALVWQDVLGVARVGLWDDFFAIGGGSVAAAQVVARIRAEVGLPVSVRQLFDHPTVGQLVASAGVGGGPAHEGTAHGGPARDSSAHGGTAHEGLAATGANPRSLPAGELAAEAVLPADVVPAAATAAGPPYRCVLLTGGTGYTGAFLLREIMNRSTADVLVLARATSAEHAAHRVETAMRRFGLWREAYRPRVRGLPGDLDKPYLGLTRQLYQQVAQQADVVIHNGASSSYALPYASLKPTNVLGTVEVLRLACAGRTKPVHFVSSLAVFPGHPGADSYPEAELTDADGVVGGYRQTTWVADRLVTEAGHRGLPVCVYRPGQITGAQDTGACSEDTFLNAFVKGCIQLGAALDFDVRMEMSPVDVCAATVAHTALVRGERGVVVHLPGARSVSWAELVDLLGRSGYPLRALPYRDWYAALTTALSGGEDNELARFLPLFGPDGPAPDLGYEHAAPRYDTDNLRRVTAGTGIAYRPVDHRLMATYLDYFVSTGFLPPLAPHRGEESA